MKKQILCAFAMFMLLFSVLSGCKTKKKLVENYHIKEKVESKKLDSTKLLTRESSQDKTVDSTKKTESTKNTTISKSSYEIHIKLDSNKKALMDTTGSFDIRKLINAGLQNASSLIIKVEDQQSQSQENSKTKQHHLTKTRTQDSTKDSTGLKMDDQKKNLNANGRNVSVDSDSTVSNNTGGTWFLVGFVAIVVILFFIWLNKKH